jgi:hypothetical protein
LLALTEYKAALPQLSQNLYYAKTPRRSGTLCAQREQMAETCANACF